MDRITGSMEVLSAMQLTADTEGFDTECKALLMNKEVLAVILKEAVEEYREYTLEEIMDFIEFRSMEDTKEVSEGRTNTRVQGDNPEFSALNEKVSFMDIVFKAKNPGLSREGVLVNLHMDLEPQKNYRPGYPVEKRGMYYLARSLSAQLSLITERTDYGTLEKCCSIWICRDNIPKTEQYSISFYEMTNTKNIGNCSVLREDFDLIKLVIIRLGNKVYNGDKEGEGYRLLHFLNLLMYPHKNDFMESISDYIDFSGNEELWREKEHMFSLGQCILEEGREEGRKEGIQALIMSNLELNVPREQTILALRRYFGLQEERAERYYREFAQEEQSE